MKLNFSKSNNKFKYVSLLATEDIAKMMEKTSRFLQRKMQEYKALKVWIESLKAEVGKNQGDALRKQSK